MDDWLEQEAQRASRKLAAINTRIAQLIAERPAKRHATVAAPPPAKSPVPAVPVVKLVAGRVEMTLDGPTRWQSTKVLIRDAADQIVATQEERLDVLPGGRTRRSRARHTVRRDPATGKISGSVEQGEVLQDDGTPLTDKE